MDIRITDRERLMDIVRAGLYENDIQLMARRVGVHPSTLMSIRSGKTKWPRHTTLLVLIHALDLELYLRKKSGDCA